MTAYIWFVACNYTYEYRYTAEKAIVSVEPITKSLTHTTTEETMSVRVSNEHTAASFCQNSIQDKGTGTHPPDKPRGQKTQRHTHTDMHTKLLCAHKRQMNYQN